jgi:hypothetical protein
VAQQLDELLRICRRDAFARLRVGHRAIELGEQRW